MIAKRNFIVASLAVALVGGGFAIARESQNTTLPVQARTDDPSSASRASLPAFADLAERVSPAVVNIKVTAVARTNLPDESYGENFPVPRLSQSCSPTTP